MTFRPAQCPTCGGSLQVPDDHATVRCLYCGGAVIVREAIQAAAAASIPNLLKLARTAAASENHQEAYDYYSRVLELDGDNSDAWVSKGEAAGWLTSKTSRLPEMINCFRNAIEVANDQTRDDVRKRIADVTCKITNQIYTNMRSALSPAFAEGATWTLYIESLGNLIKTLESAYTLVPDSTTILRSVVFLCDQNLGSLVYTNYRTGQKNWRALSPDWNSYLSQRRDHFSEKLYALDPTSKPTQIISSGLLEGVIPKIKASLTPSQWAIVGGGCLLLVVVLVVGSIENRSLSPQHSSRSQPGTNKFPGTAQEKAYLEASGRYLGVHFENCKSVAETMAGASDGRSSLADIRSALLGSRSRINDSWENDFLKNSKGAPSQKFTDFDRKLRRVHALQDDAFAEILRYWNDERLIHITKGNDMFQTALLECDSVIKDLNKILESFSSALLRPPWGTPDNC